MCWRYEPLTAAIAAATIDCQGTIGPNSFKVDDKGELVPTFTSCIPGATQSKAANAAIAPAPVAASAAAPTPAAGAVAKAAPTPAGSVPPATSAAQAGPAPAASTDAAQAAADYALLTQLLAFQRLPDLPGIHECVGGRWTRWAKLFERTGITTCPTWQKTEVIGNPKMSDTDPKQNLTALQLAQMQPRLPVAPKDCNRYPSKEERRKCVLTSVHEQLEKDPALREDQKLADIIVPPKTSATYTVSVDPSVKCTDAAVCAAQCAAGFPGFVLAASNNRVDGDATYWLNPDPPFTFAGYQHPMAQYHGPPGDVYGHVNRAGEQCWRWDDFDGLYVEVLIDASLPGLPISHCGNF
ncbi:MAG: hypothetical protein ACOY0T_08165 [Myxococcota bacterium]